MPSPYLPPPPQPTRLAFVIRRIPFEAVIWTAGLIALACTNPNEPGLFELCAFKWVGFEWSPGCGLGHAVAHLFRGEWLASWHAHPLGGPALVILTGRIVTLVRDAWRSPSLASSHPM